MNLSKILIGICSLLFFMIGADKFLGFMNPPCSLQHTVPSAIWIGLGVLQIAGGILIWLPKFRKLVVWFFVAFMLFFIVYHLVKGTTDVGGAIFMLILLGLIGWNPSFLGAKNS